MQKQLILNEEALRKVLGSSNLSDVYAIVEATSFEMHELYMNYTIEGFVHRAKRYGADPSALLDVPPYKWETPYNWSTITIADSSERQEFFLDLRFVLVKKMRDEQWTRGILFHNDQQGTFVDRQLIKQWLTHWFPRQMQTPYRHTDAQNFALVLQEG